jgi:hypothetical protein
MVVVASRYSVIQFGLTLFTKSETETATCYAPACNVGKDKAVSPVPQAQHKFAKSCYAPACGEVSLPLHIPRHIRARLLVQSLECPCPN